MKTVHTFGIAILLAVAAALGVAAARPAGASHAQAAGSSPATAVATAAVNPSVRLDRWQHQLQRALRKRLPKLPRLVHFPRVTAPPVMASAASPVISQVSAQAPRTIYVHAKAAPAATHGHEHESDREHSGGGGQDD
jgi:hypothetical protein